MRLVRIPTEQGAILYDPARISHPQDEDFDAGRLMTTGRIQGTARGRGSVWFVSARDHDGNWVLRHYRSGGLVARWAGDRYAWLGEEATRPFRELRLLEDIERLGLPAVRGVAARYRRTSLGYRADLLTLAIPRTRSLASLLKHPQDADLWQRVGETLRRFHAAGVCHADLNAHNILIEESGGVHLVDFDRGVRRAPGAWCDGNIRRLRRSIDKLVRTEGAQVSPADWSALCRGYAQSRDAL
jgi:3-deoxy-D-manno-octulosonic acid kinase